MPKIVRRILQIIGGAVVAFVVLGIIAVATAPSKHTAATSSDAHEPPSPKGLPFAAADLEPKIRAKVAEGDLFKRGSLSVGTWTEGDVSMSFRFSAGAIEPDLPEVTAMGIGKLTIDELIAAGFNPREHNTMIHVWVEQPAGPSVTGAAQVRLFGSSTYNSYEDKLTYEAKGND